MKRHLIFVIVFLVSLGYLSGQEDEIDWSTITVEEAFRPKMPNKMDTLYYPFYDGVQMIEVDQIGFWDRKIYYLEQTYPRAMPHSMFHPMPVGNEYFFRDSNGKITKAFNTKYSLKELTEHFKNIPLDKKGKMSMLFPYHKNQPFKYEGAWPYSPNSLYDFQGFYKISSGFVEQDSLNYSGLRFEETNGLRFGLIDSLGNIRIPLEYDEINPWYSNLLVKKNDKWGIINYEQKIMVPLDYDNHRVDTYSGSVYPDKIRNIFFIRQKGVKNNKAYSTYDAVFVSSKNELIPLNNYDEIYFEGSWIPNEDYSKRALRVVKNGKIGILNANYKEIIAPEYESFQKDDFDLIRVNKDGKFGFLDKNFKTSIPLKYDFAGYFSDSTALVLKDGEFYCIDSKGKKQLNCDKKPYWREITNLDFNNEEYLVVEYSGFYGLINKESNKMILPINYEKINYFPYDKFQKDHFFAFRNNRITILNLDNKKSVSLKYDDLKYDSSGPFLQIKLEDKWGIFDYHGKEIVPCQYDSVRFLDQINGSEEKFWIVEKNGKFGIVRENNELLIPFKFDGILYLEGSNLWVMDKAGQRYTVSFREQIINSKN